MSFLPKGYEVPTPETGYLKLTPGVHKFRIMSDAILGWVAWADNKPVRFKEEPKNKDEWENPPKHFWSFVVWNYGTKRFQILEVTQVTIQREIEALYINEDWGDPTKYDFSITRNGEGKDNTSYTVQPSPHKEIPKEVQDHYKSININLGALFEGGDPFANVDTGEHEEAGDRI